MKKWISCLVVFGLALPLGCGPESPDQQNNQNQGSLDSDGDSNGEGDGFVDDLPEDYDGPTYYADIQPLMQAHCTSCHVQDSIAPFALLNYQEVRDTAILSHATMQAGTMPPWPPAEDCQEFQGHRGMTVEEIALFKEWIDEGYPRGNSADAPSVETNQGLTLGEADLTLTWGFDYKPTPVGGDQIDDYRCFVVDVPTEEDVFVNLVDTKPGNAAVVHHMIAYLAPPSQFARLSQLEQEDSRPGYTCFGGPRFNNPEMLAGWVPGTTPIPYKEGYGIRVPAGHKLVVQMHYNTVNDPEGTDQTLIDLHLVDREAHPNPKELVIIPLADFGLFVAAGDPEGYASAEGPSIPIPLMLHGIAPHMHMLGSAIRTTISTGRGDMCLIDIPNWDFNWQGFYVYKEPIRLAPPSLPLLECWYDNSASNQAPGREPRNVTWGDGTYDEMCLVYFIVERPPGL